MHIMLDLETWSVRSTAVIVSIGACVFNPMDEGALATFYESVNPCEPLPGAQIDPATILWWMAPERAEARAHLLGGPSLPLDQVLRRLTAWAKVMQDHVGDGEEIRVWGNGANFDNVILRESYRMAGQEPFWSPFADRCYRTVKSLSDIKLRRVGVHHHAMDDAVSQAMHLQEIVKALSLRLD